MAPDPDKVPNEENWSWWDILFQKIIAKGKIEQNFFKSKNNFPKIN